MGALDLFFIGNIIFILISRKLCKELVFPTIEMLETVINVVTIINFCLIIFDVFYIILKIVLKTSKKANEIHFINKNNDD